MPSRAPTFRLQQSKRLPRTEDRGSASSRGYGAQWRKLRDQIYIRDAGTCQSCGAVVAGREAHVDHIIAKRDGGADVGSNLQVLCSACHGIKTRLEARRGGAKGEGAKTSKSGVLRDRSATVEKSCTGLKQGGFNG